MSKAPPDVIAIYGEHGAAKAAAAEWRMVGGHRGVRVVKRTVGAFGAVTGVWAVCVWFRPKQQQTDPALTI